MNGMLALDLRSGAVRSFRYGKLQGDNRPHSTHGRNSNRSASCYTIDLAPLCRWGDFVAVAQSGVGILLYPANDSGNRSIQDVRVISRRDGLQDLDILWLTGIGDDLFMATRTTLMVWNRVRGDVQMLANNKGTLDDSPFAGLTFTAVSTGSTANAITVAAAASTGPVTQCFMQTQGVWQAIAGEATVTNRTSGAKLIARSSPQPEYRSHNLFWSPLAPPPTMPPMATRDGVYPDYDTVGFADGCIFVTGWGEDWKLEYLSTNAAPASLSWAPPSR